MKRVIGVVSVIMLTVVLSCGCGKKTYTCGWCGSTVTQSPHHAKILGQEIELCDDCYKGIKEMQTQLD